MARRTAVVVLACTVLTLLATILAGSGEGPQAASKEKKAKPVEEFTANFVDMNAAGAVTQSRLHPHRGLFDGR